MDVALAEAQSKLKNPADRALVAAITFGVIREWRLLDAIAAKMWKKAPVELAQALILVGIYQLRSMRVPPHAAVHATVAATNALRIPKMRGMVNALLRRFQRDQAELEANLKASVAIQTSHPDWLVGQIKADWPDLPGQWQAILAENNNPAPMVLRVNTRMISVEKYLKRLEHVGMQARVCKHAPSALQLSEPAGVDDLPGFSDGQISVQDGAAQLAAPLLDIQSGMRVLDACAAPGGKAAHCLELADCALLALDVDEQRLELVQESFKRLGLASDKASTRCADASQVKDWWDGTTFDRILIDAPCTGTGVIRRHPDIKWLRRDTDVAALAERQTALLTALWPLLSPNGVLVYATCSTLQAEGGAQIEEFLGATADAKEEPITQTWGEAANVGRKIAPGQDDMDGFYYARLRKA